MTLGALIKVVFKNTTRVYFWQFPDNPRLGMCCIKAALLPWALFLEWRVFFTCRECVLMLVNILNWYLNIHFPLACLLHTFLQLNSFSLSILYKGSLIPGDILFSFLVPDSYQSRLWLREGCTKKSLCRSQLMERLGEGGASGSWKYPCSNSHRTLKGRTSSLNSDWKQIGFVIVHTIYWSSCCILHQLLSNSII